MKSWFLPLAILFVQVLCGSALAQNDTLAGTASTDDQLPTPISAVPPPDPATPGWGNFVNPTPSLIAPRATEYNIVGPPGGLTQQIDGQDYQTVVTDPNSVLDGVRQIGQVIDLFRPDGMAPVGVFGDHTLPVGTIFVSYRYLQNSYDQNYIGSQRISVNSIAAHYPYAPANMIMNSQVALVEYGVTKDVTMMAYLPFQHNEINSQTANGDYKAAFTNPGDIRIQSLIVINRGENSQSHLNLGLSIPVGMLESAQTMPAANVPNLPYQIRASSGTYDLMFGYTYRGQSADWTWGAQANAVIPTGINALGYELGNQAQLTSWLSRRWTDRWSTSARLDAHFIGNMRGADARLNTALSPANLSTTQGSDYLNGLLGVNFYLSRPESRLFEQRLFLEGGLPLYETVNGPQLGITWILNAGWGMSF
jgi:hypothetical protein